MAKCKAKTKSGQACKMAAGKDGYCFAHSPAHGRARAQARKLGGQNRHTPHAGNPATIATDIQTIQDARTILNYVMAELLAADNSIPRNRALLALFDSFVKSLEIGELEKRIASLEDRAK